MNLRLLLLCVCLSACGSGEAADGRLRIAVIPKGTNHEFFKAVHAGAQCAARELDVQIIWKGPQKEDDRAGQVRTVEDFVTKGVDGIVLMPLDRTALVRPAKQALERGIPVVIADSDLEWDGRVSFVATDNHRGGVLAGEQLAKFLGGQGRVLMMRYQEGSASTEKREQGFLDAIAEHPGLELISSNQYAGATIESAQKTAENLLNGFRDVDGIFCPNESSAYGMLRALVSSGRDGEVRFVGFDSSEKLVAGLREGHIDALVLQDPVKMGYEAVRALVRHLDGEQVKTRIDTGVAVATLENMQNPAVAELLSPDLSLLGE